MMSVEQYSEKSFTKVDNMPEQITISDYDKAHINSIADNLKDIYIISKLEKLDISIQIDYNPSESNMKGNIYRVLFSYFAINKETKDLYILISTILNDDTGVKLFDNSSDNYLAINLSTNTDIHYINNTDSNYHYIKINNELVKSCCPSGIWCNFHLSNK